MAQVSEALEPLIPGPRAAADKTEVEEGEHIEKPDTPSPLTTESAAQVFAASAGVTVDQARAALATLVHDRPQTAGSIPNPRRTVPSRQVSASPPTS